MIIESDNESESKNVPNYILWIMETLLAIVTKHFHSNLYMLT